MKGDCFVDSNVWLYAFMDDTSPKHGLATDLIQQANIVLSTQVLNEVCSNLIRKVRYTEEEIQQTIHNFEAHYPIIEITVAMVQTASLLRSRYSLSYWDSLMLATAEHSQCSTIYSEDMQDGLCIGEMTIVNPFRRE